MILRFQGADIEHRLVEDASKIIRSGAARITCSYQGRQVFLLHVHFVILLDILKSSLRLELFAPLIISNIHLDRTNDIPWGTASCTSSYKPYQSAGKDHRNEP